MESLRYSGNQRRLSAVKENMRALLALTFALALSAGCGTEYVPRTEPISHELVLEVEHVRGGPVVALYADGRLFTPAPQIAIYPAPALPAFSVARIPPDRATKIVENMLASGLLDAPPAPGDGTLVTTVVDGERRVARLGAKKAEALNRLLGELPVSSGDSLYEPTALAVLAGAPEEAAEGIEPETRDWPLGDLSPGCSVVRGPELRSVLDAAARANQLTRWRIAGGLLVGVTFRPLLPHETSCEDVA